jgi:predicted kinase
VISVDPIEAAMWRASIERSQPTGLAAYIVAESMAAEVLALGQVVIVDAVNAVAPAREQWCELASRMAVPLRVLEVVCSNEQLHRQRLEERRRDIEGFHEPSWEDVQRRKVEYLPWSEDRLVLDTAADLEDNVAAALRYLDSDLIT